MQIYDLGTKLSNLGVKIKCELFFEWLIVGLFKKKKKLMGIVEFYCRNLLSFSIFIF